MAIQKGKPPSFRVLSYFHIFIYLKKTLKTRVMQKSPSTVSNQLCQQSLLSSHHSVMLKKHSMDVHQKNLRGPRKSTESLQDWSDLLLLSNKLLMVLNY